jgi:preprotein translocase subunit SecA
LPARVFTTQAFKRRAIAEEVRKLIAAQRSVLIGTPSVSASEALSELLTTEQIDHVVLNARYLEAEAEIVAQAVQPGRVTIATNMAGRGTDILLHESVRAAGGLHVIATEMHTSARIDRQLVGRAARQGDPGSFQFMLSLEDELLHVLTLSELQKLRSAARPDDTGELSPGYLKLFRKTQRQLERMHAKHRKQLLKHQGERLKRYRRMGLDPHLELVEN